MRIMDPRHNSEIILLSRLREALDEAYRQQNLHHEDRDEFTYWQCMVWKKPFGLSNSMAPAVGATASALVLSDFD